MDEPLHRPLPLPFIHSSQPPAFVTITAARTKLHQMRLLIIRCCVDSCNSTVRHQITDRDERTEAHILSGEPLLNGNWLHNKGSSSSLQHFYTLMVQFFKILQQHPQPISQFLGCLNTDVETDIC